MTYNIVVYGSLLSHESLRKTIPDKKFTSVIVKGYKRIFNLALKGGNDPDLLNIMRAKDHSFNGVMFQADDQELTKIKERESYYNLEETSAYDFTTGKKLCKCLIVADYLVAIDHHAMKPNRNYFTLCREAAYYINNQFGKFWDETTYISDGEKVSDWLEANGTYNTIN